MKKKELLKMKEMQLTAGMIKAAKTDIPEKRTREEWHYNGHYTGTTYHYKYRLFINATQMGYILKVSLWFRESVVKEQRKPDYDIYLDRKNKDFITYVTDENRWSNAKFGFLDLPQSFRDGKKIWMSGATSKRIMEFFNNGRTGIDAIHAFQLNVRAEQLKQRERKETDEWDRAQDIVPDIPAGFKEWIKKYPQQMNYIVYEYSRKGATKGWCSFCEKEVDIKNPKHLKEGICTKCRKKITFLAKGKSGGVRREDTAQLIQKTDTGVIVRSFNVIKKYHRGNLCNPELYFYETTRSFYDQYSNQRHTYYYENYKQKEMRWVSSDYWDGHNRYWNYEHNNRDKTATYKATLSALKTTSLKYSGLKEMLMHSNINPTRYIDVYKIFPEVEKLVKAGFYQTVEDILIRRRETEFIHRGKNPKEILDITQEELKLLKAAGGGIMKLSMIKWMRGRNGATKMTPEQLNKLVKYDSGKQLEKLYQHTTIHKAIRYIESQEDFNAGDFHDYLHMCEELEYDLNNSFILFPKNWKRAHDQASKEHNMHKVEIEAKKKSKQSMKIEKRYEETKKLYDFKYKGLSIVVPHNALEIIQEGHVNHHCVATYVDRVADGNTTILFVREEEDVTYYTMEVRDNNIIQCRTKYNKSYTENKKVEEFVKRFDKKVLEPLRMKEKFEQEELRQISAEIDAMVLAPAI